MVVAGEMGAVEASPTMQRVMRRGCRGVLACAQGDCRNPASCGKAESLLCAVCSPRPLRLAPLRTGGAANSGAARRRRDRPNYNVHRPRRRLRRLLSRCAPSSRHSRPLLASYVAACSRLVCGSPQRHRRLLCAPTACSVQRCAPSWHLPLAVHDQSSVKERKSTSSFQ